MHGVHLVPLKGASRAREAHLAGPEQHLNEAQEKSVTPQIITTTKTRRTPVPCWVTSP